MVAPRARGRGSALTSAAARPPRRPNVSAGLLLFRRTARGLELFLAHPGGPFWSQRDAGAWTIPKGVPDAGEPLEQCARREFEEETGIVPGTSLIPLGSVKQKAGKVVHAWAWEGDGDPASVRSNTMKTEWPRGSGRWLTFPEVDRCEWFAADVAREKVNAAQVAFIDRLVTLLEDVNR